MLVLYTASWNRAVNGIMKQTRGTSLYAIFLLFYRSSLANLAVLNFPKKHTLL